MSRQEQNDLVRSLLAELDAHAPGERIHAERVAVYAVAMAFELGFRGDQLIAVKVAAELHDIGKLGIAPSVLSSQDEPDEVHLAEYRIHPLLAGPLLKGHESLTPLARWIRLHHERIDGSGYPMGHLEDDIPLESQIIGLAEWFDTSANGRSWRQARGEEEAWRLLPQRRFADQVVESLRKVQPLIQPVAWV